MGIGNLGTFCHHPKIRWLLYTILLAASGAPLRTHGFLASGLYLNVLVIGSITPTILENPVGWFLTFYKGRIEDLSIHGVLSWIGCLRVGQLWGLALPHFHFWSSASWLIVLLCFGPQTPVTLLCIIVEYFHIKCISKFLCTPMLSCMAQLGSWKVATFLEGWPIYWVD